MKEIIRGESCETEKQNATWRIRIIKSLQNQSRKKRGVQHQKWKGSPHYRTCCTFIKNIIGVGAKL